MMPAPTVLDEILADVRRELAAAKQQRPWAELQRMVANAPPVRPFPKALRAGFGLIAEIKERSPSQGAMRAANVAAAAVAYQNSPLVRGISVLTNATHFGMSLERLRQVKLVVTKPVLRKDFIFEEYQVWEARAFGADAVLLMANMLDVPTLRRLYALTRELGMEALFECHDREQIARVPADAVLYGVNSRSFTVRGADYAEARARRAAGQQQDFTTDLRRFAELAAHLPAHALKIAESGVHPETAAPIRDALGYDAILVGTSLLTAPEGIEAALRRFEQALARTA